MRNRLETGLRTISLGFPFLLLLRIEATEFPTLLKGEETEKFLLPFRIAVRGVKGGLIPNNVGALMIRMGFWAPL